jgi:hypothetical protein
MTEQKIMPCPFCGGELKELIDGSSWACGNKECPTCYAIRSTFIAAHNQHCEYVRLGKLVEEFLEKPPYRSLENLEVQTLICRRNFNQGVRACLDFFKVEVENTVEGSGE